MKLLLSALILTVLWLVLMLAAYLLIYSDYISYNECKFTWEQFCKLLNFAVKDNHCIFDKQLYDQIDGVAMDSKLGPSLANIFLCALKQSFLIIVLLNLSLFFVVVMFMILFVFFVKCSKLNRSCLILFPVMKTFLQLNKKLITNSCFLILLSHLITTVSVVTLIVRKLLKGLCNGFDSLAPHAWKVNLVLPLDFRAYNTCFTYFNFHIELSRNKCFLKENSFPVLLVKSFLGHIFFSAGKKPKTIEVKPTLFFSTPFLGPGSLHLKSRISRLIIQCYPCYILRIVFFTPKRIFHITRYLIYLISVFPL